MLLPLRLRFAGRGCGATLPLRVRHGREAEGMHCKKGETGWARGVSAAHGRARVRHRARQVSRPSVGIARPADSGTRQAR